MNEYTVPNIPQQLDVVVVGSGAAGLYASLCLPSHYQVGIVTKGPLKAGASQWAQGGIAAAIAADDSPQLHLEDTVSAGVGLCEPETVRFLVENAAAEIDALIKLGVAFDREGKDLATTLEAAHSRSRILHSCDTTGRAIVGQLAYRVLSRPNIQILSNAAVLSVWQHPHTQHCQGVCLLSQNKIHWIQAKAVLLATGGCGQIFARTTNPDVATGDGAALAWRAGAVLRDLEFVQFHPTVLHQKGAPNFLISEAVRGEGAHLVDAAGQRFIFNYHPQGELAPRDVVSRSIFRYLQTTAHTPQVYLDFRAIAPNRIRYRFPNIIRQCQHWGIDVFHQLVPVAPAAHYWMGGIAVDIDNATSVPGLFAIGETASTGVHGANRLASNSLLECVVFAAQFKRLQLPTMQNVVKQTAKRTVGDWTASIAQVEYVRKALPPLMWNSAGICRSLADLSGALGQVNAWRSQLSCSEIGKYLFQLAPAVQVELESEVASQQLRLAAETLNLLDVSYLMLKSAIFRQESRGGHYRGDFPDISPAWQQHTVLWANQIKTQPIHIKDPILLTR